MRLFHSTIGVETDWSDENASPLEDIRRAIRERETVPEHLVELVLHPGYYDFLVEYARTGAFLRAHGVNTDDPP